MASIAIMIGEVLINATAFVGGSFRARNRVKKQAKQNVVDTGYALKLYNEVHNQELDLREP